MRERQRKGGLYISLTALSSTVVFGASTMSVEYRVGHYVRVSFLSPSDRERF